MRGALRSRKIMASQGREGPIKCLIFEESYAILTEVFLNPIFRRKAKTVMVE